MYIYICIYIYPIAKKTKEIYILLYCCSNSKQKTYTKIEN